MSVIENILGKMETVQLTKKDVEGILTLDPDLELAENEGEVLVRAKTKAVDFDDKIFLLEIIKKGNSINAVMSKIEVIDGDVDHGKEPEKFLDDPSDLGR